MKNDLGELIDRDLAGLVWDEAKSQRVRRTLDGKEKMMTKKLPPIVAVVLALTVLGMAAALASSLGLLHFRDNQKENEAFTQSIFNVGQSYENENLTISLNEAVFDGTRLSLTMSILPKAGGERIFVYPHVSASVNGKTVTAFIKQSPGQFPNGFFMPDIEGMEDEVPAQQYVEIALMDNVEIAAQNEAVNWTLTFDMYRPNWPVSVTLAQWDSDQAEDSTTNKSYYAMFLEAYRNQKILINGLCMGGGLSAYGTAIRREAGTALDDDILYALQTDAFTPNDKAVFTFTTRAENKTSPQVGQTFPLSDGWQAELTAFNASFANIDCTLKLTRTAADGKTAMQAYEDGEYPWDFAILPDNGTILYPTANGYNTADGAIYWIGTVEISSPANHVTLVPCRTDDIVLVMRNFLLWPERVKPLAKLPTEEKIDGVYENNAPVTDTQKALAFTLDICSR